jgi:hypothetical protein
MNFPRFLMPVFQLDRILVERTATRIRKALRLLPSRLEDTYKETLLRIQSQGEPDNSLGMRVLMWISRSKRPLLLEELRHALSVEWNDYEDLPWSLDHGNILGLEDLIGVCAGLVIIETESQIVRLVHFTTEEIFRSSPETWFPNADVQISKTCLVYLSFDAFQESNCSAEEMKARVPLHPLLYYAVYYWYQHYREQHDLETENIALGFLKSPCGFVTSSSGDILILRKNKRWKRSGLHVASSHGLQRLVAKLLEIGAEAYQTDDRGWSPLARALERVQESVAILLLEIDTGVDSKSPHKKQAATESNNW